MAGRIVPASILVLINQKFILDCIPTALNNGSIEIESQTFHLNNQILISAALGVVD